MSSSSASERMRRAMACVAINSAARSAIAPNTAKAMEIGFSERSGFGDGGCEGVIRVLNVGRDELRQIPLDGGHRPPRRPAVFIPNVRAPANPPSCARTSRVSAGVSGTMVGNMSTSSSTISVFRDARPTSLRLTRRAGGTAFVPNPGLRLLSVGVEAVGNDLAHVKPEELGGDGATTISPARCGRGHSTLGHPKRSWERTAR